MHTTYRHYQKTMDHLPFEAFILLHESLMQDGHVRDAYFKECWEDVLRKAISYTTCRAEYPLFSPKEKHDRNLGQARTIKHNAFILSLTILKRYMMSEGWSVDWADALDLEDADTHRQKIGDFANYLTLIQALNAR